VALKEAIAAAAPLAVGLFEPVKELPLQAERIAATSNPTRIRYAIFMNTLCPRCDGRGGASIRDKSGV
jgi:hypothetical protein